MKMFTLRVFAIAGLLAASAFTTFAQSNGSLRVHVPFNFTVGHQNMPAGDYVIQQDGTSGLMTLQSRNAGSAAAVLTSGGTLPQQGATTPELVFERRQGRVVLTQVRFSNQPSRVLSSALNSAVAH